jgi:hypothetical protein
VAGRPAPVETDAARWASATGLGVPAFNELYFVTDDGTRSFDRWGLYQHRAGRYAVLWSHYEGNVYRKVHRWAEQVKDAYGLYSFIRTIYSPAYRIGEFWSRHLYPGDLDQEAGDGRCRPSAIPIEVADGNPKADALRAALALILRQSNFQAHKETYARYGSVLGDVGLEAVDDEARRKVYLRVVHPATIRDVTRDPFSNVKGYVIQERRPDPRHEDPLSIPPLVTYTEVVTRVRAGTRYRTLLDSEPWDWRDYPDERAREVGPDWTEDYGFVPLVFVQHRDMGIGFGWAEVYPGLSKLHELDDQASKLCDQVRKLVECPWFFSGVENPDQSRGLAVEYPDADADDPEPGRTRVPALYGPPGSGITPMVAPLDIAAVSAHIRSLLESLREDFPELQEDIATPSGDASGRALRVARERVEGAVEQRRAGYDDALRRVLMMAVSIGAKKQYPGFEAFDEGSFERGELDFQIGARPVFAVDPAEKLDESTKRAAVLKVLKDAGVPLAVAMAEAGYSDDSIKRASAGAAAEATASLDMIRRKQVLALSDVPANGDGAMGL